MGTRWTEKEDIYLRDNYGSLTANEIGVFLKRSLKGVRNRISRLELQKEEKKLWTKDEDIFLKNNAGILTHAGIAKRLKRTKYSVDHRVIQLGLKKTILSTKTQFKKIYSVNEDFFDKINILNSYYAGLIASDGYIGGNFVSFTQSESRLYAVERFVNYVDYDGKIYKSRHKKGHDSFTVVISSKKWQKDLKRNFNIGNKKSLILEPPKDLNHNCKLAFIVGLIDGDGTIGFYNKKRNKKLSLISLCGTYDITEWVFNVWKTNCLSKNKRKNLGPRKLTANNTWYVGISGMAVIKFYELIENIDIPKMETKWGVFEEEFKNLGRDFYKKDFSKERKRSKNGTFI